MSCASLPTEATIDGYTIKYMTIEAQEGIAMRKKVAMTELSATYGAGLGKAFAYAGPKVAGMPFAIYHAWGDGQVDVEFGCPVSEKMKGDGGELHPVTIPGGKVIKTVHKGSYHELPKAHAAIDGWLEKYGAEKAGPPWEVYVDDPSKVAADEVRTFVFYPIK